jgi:ABC-type transport system substrate-binding protein
MLEWAALLKEHIKKRQFQAIILGWGTGPDPDQYVVWHSSQMGPDQLNHISYANPDADALLEAGRSSCVQADRVRYYRRLHQVLADDQPLVFLYWRDSCRSSPRASTGSCPRRPGSAGTSRTGSCPSSYSATRPADAGPRFDYNSGPMLAYVVRRLFLAVPLLLGITFVSFWSSIWRRAIPCSLWRAAT